MSEIGSVVDEAQRMEHGVSFHFVDALWTEVRMECSCGWEGPQFEWAHLGRRSRGMERYAQHLMEEWVKVSAR